MNHGVLFKISIFSDMFKFITILDFLFFNNFYSASCLLKFSNTILKRELNVVPLKTSSYSVAFASNDSALSFSVAAKTLNPKGLIAKK